MWADGVTLYNLPSMDVPYEGDDAPDVFKKARLGNFTLSDAFDDVFSDAKSLIRAVRNVENRKRATGQTVLLHPWLDPLIDVSGCVPNDDDEKVYHHRHPTLRILTMVLSDMRRASSSCMRSMR